MSSSWGKISSPKEIKPAQDEQGQVSLADIMSEQYASFLMEQDVNGKTTSSEDSDSPPVDHIDHINESPQNLSSPEEEITTDNDFMLAQLLQAEFDKEYNESQEQVRFDGAKKVDVSFDYFRKKSGGSSSDSEEETKEEEDKLKHDEEKERAWDRFDQAERDESGITLGRKGFVKSEGNIRTKHDPAVCGRQNACRLMGFDLSTGDCGGFDMKLNNNVYNALKVHSKSENKRAARLREKKEKSSVEHVMDEKTRLILYKLVNGGILDEINGAISTGKESHVYHGIGGDPEKQITCGEVAIKVYKTTLNEFKNREAYIKDDHRFKDKFSRQNPRKIIHLWAEKEMHNLARIRRAGIPCPEVVMLKEHILVMKFIGAEGKHAPSLKDAVLSSVQLIKAYADVVEIMKKLYTKCELIHGDLSEYNLLWYLNKIWVIDVSQSVLRNHPNAFIFLARDCYNITNFFTKNGLSNPKSSGELFFEITGKPLVHDSLSSLEHLISMHDYERDQELLTYGISSKMDNFDELFAMISADKATTTKSFSKAAVS